MIKILMVGIGGFAGSICRYIISDLSHRLFNDPFFPYGTITVNVIGCLLIGLLGGLSETRQIFAPEIRALILIGFLGGATVTKGILGFGAHSRIHTTKILRLSEDMPMVIEIIDTLKKIDDFMPIIDRTITEGLVIVEEISIRFYRTR